MSDQLTQEQIHQWVEAAEARLKSYSAAYGIPEPTLESDILTEHFPVVVAHLMAADLAMVALGKRLLSVSESLATFKRANRDQSGIIMALLTALRNAHEQPETAEAAVKKGLDAWEEWADREIQRPSATKPKERDRGREHNEFR